MKECIPPAFCKYICQKEIVLYLNEKKLFHSQEHLKLLLDFSSKMKKTTFCRETTFLSLKIFFNMFTQMCTLKYIVPPKEEIST